MTKKKLKKESKISSKNVSREVWVAIRKTSIYIPFVISIPILFHSPLLSRKSQKWPGASKHLAAVLWENARRILSYQSVN